MVNSPTGSTYTGAVSSTAQRLNTGINRGPIRHQTWHDGFKFLCEVLTVSPCQIDLTPRSADASGLSTVKCCSPTWLTRRPAASSSSSSVSVGRWALNVDVNTARCTTSYTHHSATPSLPPHIHTPDQPCSSSRGQRGPETRFLVLGVLSPIFYRLLNKIIMLMMMLRVVWCRITAV